jgi:hypothetical protein
MKLKKNQLKKGLKLTQINIQTRDSSHETRITQ